MVVKWQQTAEGGPQWIVPRGVPRQLEAERRVKIIDGLIIASFAAGRATFASLQNVSVCLLTRHRDEAIKSCGGPAVLSFLPTLVFNLSLSFLSASLFPSHPSHLQFRFHSVPSELSVVMGNLDFYR